MLQLLGWILLAIIVAGGLCALAVVFLPAGEQIAPTVRDEPVWELPAERELRPEDVDSVRLPVALRGYRFAETDLLLDRLAEEIRARDAVIARLSETVAPAYPVPGDRGSRGGTPDPVERAQAQEVPTEAAPDRIEPADADLLADAELPAGVADGDDDA